MLDRQKLTVAVDLQRRSYALLRWLAEAVRRGFVTFDAAHTYATLPAAAQAWVDRHFADIPPDARPPHDEREAFARMFASYLETSFELVREPGRKLYSPDAHCFCPMCSWLVDAPNLRTKKLERTDKSRAEKQMRGALHAIAAELEVDADESLLEELREPLAYVAYGRDLLERARGGMVGPSTLALWREFAWTRTGAPRKGFVLTADAILDAEANVARSLSAS